MKKIILVVEDNVAVLQSIRYCLTMEGFSVITANNGQDALGVLNNQFPDLIISDIMMPKMDGYTFYQNLQSHTKLRSIPFLFLTAKAGKKDIRIGKEMGVDDYIIKPFEPMDLVSTVKGKLLRHQDHEVSRLQEIEQLSDHFLTYLINKLHSPLTLVRGWMHILLDPRYQFPDEELQNIYKTVVKGCAEMDNLLENFTFLEKLQEFKRSDHFMEGAAALSVNKLLNHVCNKIKSQFQDVRIKMALPESTFFVKGHSKFLSKMFEELMENAAKFTQKEPKQIQISLYPSRDQIKVEILDNGSGIAVNDLDRIFNKFFQCDPDRTEGTGLGLALAKMSVELHGGSISVDSLAGQGSIFRVILPRITPTEDEQITIEDRDSLIDLI
ncbi:MAG: hypothetical protein B6244_05715 [Candidatus Cloacimonetes bacterium 4572_55]|nr:MAG: hypothetical protein B6244_05715 [Candidatus Cloacimonetes bacterium 4572_55]